MGESTAIAWTDHTFNPWWGCTRVSPGCEHCYAETFAKQHGGRTPDVGGHELDGRIIRQFPDVARRHHERPTP